MNIKSLTIVFTFFFALSAFADVELTGVYQGKNIYVQNPHSPNLKDFCTREVFVNEVKMMENVTSSAFEIDLSFLPLHSPVHIRITHRDDCMPKILNPGVILQKSTFSFNSVNIEEHLIAWSGKNEKSKGRYFIERFEFNHWRTIAEIYAQNKGRYEFPVNHNSGLNRYRIKYNEENGNSIYSEVLEYQSKQPAITFYPKRVSDNLFLSRDADYEILDKYGNLIKKGGHKEIELTQLSSDVYYLNVDNRTYKFFKK